LKKAGLVLAILAAVVLTPLLMNVIFPLASPAAVALALGAETGKLRTYRIPSSAMEPTLHCAAPASGCEAKRSDRVVVRGWGSYGRGDLVAFHTPPAATLKCGAGGTFLKRMIGLPGERVEIRLRNGAAYVWVNGKPLDESYVENDRRDIGPAATYRVPLGHYFVMGDNRSQSCDSRVWGSVPRDNVIGKVFMTYWPPQRISFR
jgi:signal peptidase I